MFTYRHRHSGSLCVAVISEIAHRALRFEWSGSECWLDGIAKRVRKPKFAIRPGQGSEAWRIHLIGRRGDGHAAEPLLTSLVGGMLLIDECLHLLT